MAFETPGDLLPPSWIASWSEDATDITIPLASLDVVDAADADAASGDIRQCLFGLLYQCEGAYRNRDVNNLATIHKMQLSKVATIDTENDEEVTTFTCVFRNTRTLGDVPAEP